MLDSALLRNGLAPTFRQPIRASSGSTRRGVGVVPCALVYVETDSAGSPNCTNADPFCYVEQAITLNRSLRAVGLPGLTIATNVADQVEQYLAKVEPDARPHVFQLGPSTLTLPKITRFYSAHFKLDMMEQLGAMLQEGELLMVLDTDMLALHALNEEVLRRCQSIGVGAFDISDQEFSAYGDACVIADLETVAGTRLQNPRWFGGEVLVASAAFINELVPRAQACFEQYRRAIHELNHNGDEAFISAALNCWRMTVIRSSISAHTGSSDVTGQAILIATFAGSKGVHCCICPAASGCSNARPVVARSVRRMSGAIWS